MIPYTKNPLIVLPPDILNLSSYVMKKIPLLRNHKLKPHSTSYYPITDMSARLSVCDHETSRFTRNTEFNQQEANFFGIEFHFLSFFLFLLAALSLRETILTADVAVTIG